MTRRVVLFLALTLCACDRPPVAWDATSLPLTGDGTLVVRDDSAAFAPAARTNPPPAEAGMCHESIRFAAPWAAWWTARPDSGVLLRIARSDDGGAHWTPAVTAESHDRGVRGCARPAPAIAYDPDSTVVHLAYFFEPAEGPGVYYEHYMASMFHAPTVIVFGESPSHVAVAARHDTVAVAYEDPNRRVSQVALALSTTSGHLFMIRLPVSGDDVAAYGPAVALSGDRVAVAWLETSSQGDDPPTPTSGRLVARVGRIQ